MTSNELKHKAKLQERALTVMTLIFINIKLRTKQPI